MKKLFKRKLFIVFFFFFLLYHGIFNTITANALVPAVFRSISKGSLTAEFKQFSLFYGVDIHNLEIRSGTDFDNQPLLKSKRIAALYNIPAIFWGNLRIECVELSGLRFYMHKKKEHWNIETLFASDKKAAIKKQPEPETKESASELNIFLPIVAQALLQLKDIAFYLHDENAGLEFQATGLNLKFSFLSHRSSKIPYSLEALQLIDRFHFSLNRQNTVAVKYKDRGYEIEHKIRLALLLNKLNQGKKLNFYSKLDVGADNITPIIEKKQLKPFSFHLGYQLNYLPEQDRLLLDYLSIKFQKQTWLSLKGKIDALLKKERYLDLTMQESQIELQPVAAILSHIPAVPNMAFAGNISLYPLSAKGKLNQLHLNMGLNGKNLYYRQGQSGHRLPYIKLAATTILDLETKQKPTAERPLPQLKKLILEKLEVQYNTIYAKLTGKIASAIELDLNVRNINLRTLTGAVTGKIAARLNVSGKDFSQLTARLTSQLNGFSYKIQNSKSGQAAFELRSQLGIHFYQPWLPDQISVNSIGLKMFNADKNQAVGLRLKNSQLLLKDGFIADIKDLQIDCYLTDLLVTLPLSLRETITPFRNQLGNQQTLQLKVNYRSQKEAHHIKGNTLLRIPALKIDDLITDYNISIEKSGRERISLHQFGIRAMNGKLHGEGKGHMQKEKRKGLQAPLGPYYPDLTFSLSLTSEKLKTLLDRVKYKGKLNIDIKLKDYLVKGLVDSQQSNIEFTQGDCSSEQGCSIYLVENLNLQLPIEHDLSLKRQESLVQGNKAKYVRKYSRSQKPNLTVQAVYGPHPSNPKKPFAYMIQKGRPGLSAYISYKENYFTMDDLKIHVLNGIIYGKDILFNVGQGKPEKMEYAAVVQVKDVDLKRMLPKETQKRFDDGEIKADINIQGNTLKDPLNNLELFFSIYQIGEDFGKSAINIVSPENVFRDWIIGNYKVDKVEVELSKGLVYANVLFKRSILSSLFVQLKDNKISQERIPLANFLKRAKSEISTYQ